MILEICRPHFRGGDGGSDGESQETGTIDMSQCTIDKCLDHGQDCCAPQSLREVAACSDGYVVHWIHQPCAGIAGEGWYACCPPPAGSTHGPGACHFTDEGARGGTMSSFAQVSKVYDSPESMRAHMRSERYGAGNLWGAALLGSRVLGF